MWSTTVADTSVSAQRVATSTPLVLGRVRWTSSLRSLTGSVAYVVTFLQIDPLLALDLSNPTEPKVMSALKIPGFSTYLRPWAEGRLLGLGVDASENGQLLGMKLSMFDTSDPPARTAVARRR